MIRSWLAGVAVVAMTFLAPAWAAIDVHEFDDPVLERRYQRFIEELRCPKCQNQNLSGSDAPIAQDLRQELARLLDEGYSDGEIVDHMVARYGSFVLYRPPVNARTAVLWLGPAAMLTGGLLVALLLGLRQRSARARGVAADWSEEELARARRAMEERGGEQDAASEESGS